MSEMIEVTCKRVFSHHPEDSEERHYYDRGQRAELPVSLVKEFNDRDVKTFDVDADDVEEYGFDQASEVQAFLRQSFFEIRDGIQAGNVNHIIDEVLAFEESHRNDTTIIRLLDEQKGKVLDEQISDSE